MRQRERIDRLRRQPKPASKKCWIGVVLILFLWSVALGNYLALIWIVPRFIKSPIDIQKEQTVLSMKSSTNNMASTSSRVVQAEKKLSDAFEFTSYNNTKSASKHDMVPGVVVLSMHRSGSSLLAGLLVKGMSFKCPGSQLERDASNPSGYFENINVVMQNDAWLQQQHVSWDSSPDAFDVTKSCLPPQACPLETRQHLNKALLHYNMARNRPWVLKDPRLCFTLPNWLKVLEGTPAVIFTFRHPWEVAESLKKRENISRAHGFKLWISYNKLAVRHSRHLCRVMSSHRTLLEDPVSEMTRIQMQLSETCGLPRMNVNAGAIKGFVDFMLVHNNSTEYLSDVLTDNQVMQEEEQMLYQKAVKVYEDLEDGTALYPNHQWP